MSKLTMEFQRQIDELYKTKSTPTREERKTAKKEIKRDVVADTRAKVWALDVACICGACRPASTDEMHEIKSRAQLRGRPAEEIFNVENCVRLSRKCHLLVTGTIGKGKALRIVCLDEALGAMGPVELTWKNGRCVVYQRAPGRVAFNVVPAAS